MIIALSLPGPFELILVMLLLAVPAAVVLLVLRGKRSGQTTRPTQPAFPVLTAAEADGPGSYRVIGVDKTTRADRELSVEAASRANAQMKAELEGVIVTSVAKQA